LPRRAAALGVEPGQALQRFSEEQAAAWAQAWLEVFAPRREGLNTRAYLWHAFSAGRYPSLTGEAAWAAYAAARPTRVVVLDNSRRAALLTDPLPLRLTVLDAVIFPVDLAWTFARTHEEGWLGPYFARRGAFP
jgi:hypothetical protein